MRTQLGRQAGKTAGSKNQPSVGMSPDAAGKSARATAWAFFKEVPRGVGPSPTDQKKRRSALPAILLVCGAFLASVGYGQTISAYDGVTPTGLAPGSPASSYPLLGFEHYDSFSGTLNPSIQLYHVGGRGNAGFDLVWNLQQVWHAKKESAGTSPIVVIDPYPQSFPSSSPTVDGLEVAGAVYSRTGINFVSCSGGGFAPGTSITRVVFRTPSGTEIELVDKNTNAAVYTIANACTSPQPTYYAGRGTLFTSTDGSAINFVADSNVLEQINSTYGEADGKLNGVLVFPNGVTYRIDNSTVTYIRDANGNKTSFTYGSDLIDVTWYLKLAAATQIVDSTGRTVTINYHDTSCTYCTSINYSGFNDGARKILISQANLSAGLLRDGGSVETFANLFPNTGVLGGSNTFDPVLPSSITFPDGFLYELRYNTYGEVNEVSVSQGGNVEYEYGDGNNSRSGSGFEGSATDGNPVIIYRRLQERREYANGINANWTAKTDYTTSYPSGMTIDTDVTTNPSGSTAAQVVHKMEGSPTDALQLNGTSCNSMTEGFENETDYGAAPATRVVHSALKTSAGCMDNPQIATVQTTNDIGQISQVAYIYDPYNNVTQETEYRFGSGAPGSALRTTVNQYKYQMASSYASATVNLVRLPFRTFVYPGANTTGTEASLKIWDYDGATPTDEADSANIPGHDPGYLASGVTTRGNVTSYYEYLNTLPSSNPYIGYQMAYDSLGNVLSAQDPLGHTTRFSYTDAFTDGTNHYTYAYLTGTTNALNQSSAQSYDFYSGSPVSSTDANGVVTSYSYWADNSGAQNAFAVDRLGVTTRDANGRKAETQLLYPNPNVTITKQDQTATGDEGVVSYDIRDAFGRPQETDQFYGTNLLVATCTKRDALGNAMFVTVPFTMTGSPACPGTTGGINTGSNPGTTYARDVLGRVTQTTYADGSVGTMSYSGTAVTTVDPAGHKKVLIYDVDQNLATVQEDPSTLNYMTQYQHDVLDNLTAVCQGGSGAAFSGTTCQNGQGRSFGYDSLSRLLTASNPESGTFTYTYDNAGNLTQRVEGARGITTTYGYDALNRLTGTSYSDGVTPSVSYTWDTAAQHGVGQLQSVTASNGVTQAFTGYDSLGNVTGSVEAVGSNSFPFVYRSNLASELVSETYPSGRVMTMGYDGAGRETNVSGLLGTTTTAYVSGISYAPQGAPTQYTYKNGVSRVLSYNARLQPARAVDGTGLSGGSIATPLFSSTWNWNFGSGSTHQDNGNLAADSYTHSGGGLSSALTFAHSFSYDNVNRLTAASEGSNWTRGFGHDFGATDG